MCIYVYIYIYMYIFLQMHKYIHRCTYVPNSVYHRVHATNTHTHTHTYTRSNIHRRASPDHNQGHCFNFRMLPLDTDDLTVLPPWMSLTGRDEGDLFVWTCYCGTASRCIACRRYPKLNQNISLGFNQKTPSLGQ